MITLGTFHFFFISFFHFFFSFTCTGASIGQVRRDSDCSALIHAHALQTFINASDEPALAEQAHLCVSSLMAVEEAKG